jgi:glycosyltransferase involved in cell wall biosynthesis
VVPFGMVVVVDQANTRSLPGFRYNRAAPRILHLSTFDAHDGAARGSAWLDKALRMRGIESSIVVGRKRSDDPAIHPMPGRIAPITSALRLRFDRIPLSLSRYPRPTESFWTIGWLPCRLERVLREFAPDIVHLHWIGAGFLPVQALKQIRCPIVWTLRDMWSFTGGCHYTAGCQRYQDACGMCPQLHSDRDADLSRAIWNRKHKHWSNLDITLVPISNWLSRCVHSSGLLHSYPQEVIPNGLDLNRFQPSEKPAARQAWHLPADRQIVVYGALRATTDPRKGYRELIAAIANLKDSGRAENLMLVVFGDEKVGDLPDLVIDFRNVGYLDDDRRLSLLYSAADIAVVPSIEEAFGKTLIEAMACRTPVVAFDSGGPKDIITHLHDGYLAQAYSVDDLATGIIWCLDQVKTGPDLGNRARAKVKAKFDIDVVAASYESLYRRILTRTADDVYG